MSESKEVESTAVRDHLALVRTDLANERTLLAYIRTSLMMAGSGVTLLKFFADAAAVMITGWALIGLGGAVIVLGLIRFFSLKRDLRGGRSTGTQ